jgi:hypothetical protein
MNLNNKKENIYWISKSIRLRGMWWKDFVMSRIRRNWSCCWVGIDGCRGGFFSCWRWFWYAFMISRGSSFSRLFRQLRMEMWRISIRLMRILGRRWDGSCTIRVKTAWTNGVFAAQCTATIASCAKCSSSSKLCLTWKPTRISSKQCRIKTETLWKYRLSKTYSNRDEFCVRDT